MNSKKKKRTSAAPVHTSAKRKAHYTAPYLLEPMHPVTINVIGCGGTGSQVLNSLARMNAALKALGHPGIFVRAVDPDVVTEANMGRQLFSPSDVGSHKGAVLIGRINRYFGYNWDNVPQLYGPKVKPANITISCVDSGKARKSIWEEMQAVFHMYGDSRRTYSLVLEPYQQPYYWMDFGNTADRGQVVIGTWQTIKQPENMEYDGVSTLKTVQKIHPDIFIDPKGEVQEPSCSLAEALHKQDLFINTNLANMGLAILWKMFRKAYITHHGLYLNLETLTTNPIPIR